MKFKIGQRFSLMQNCSHSKSETQSQVNVIGSGTKVNCKVRIRLQ